MSKDIDFVGYQGSHCGRSRYKKNDTGEGEKGT